jgi:Transglutaminase-like enzymes, putative cysteine proteases
MFDFLNNRFIFVFSIFLLNWILFPANLLSEGVDALLLNQKTDVVINSGKLNSTKSFEIEIFSRKGERYCDISIPYSKMRKVSKIEACIRNKHGEIVKQLKQSEIKNRNDFADFMFYADNSVKEFTLVYNEYPYTISYSYQEQMDEFLSVQDWCPILDIEIPTYKASLNVEVPKDYKIAIKSNRTDSFIVDSTKSAVFYHWKAIYLKPIQVEPYSPDIDSQLPEVTIIPENFRYEIPGSFMNWKTYGNWEYRLMEKLAELPETEKMKINGLVRITDTDLEKIKALYHYLQDETRYVAISVGRGGMKPTSAADVAQNKYGDCKALANYFKAILSFIGINSYYTDVYAGDKIKTMDLTFPSMQFNHVILCIPLKSDTLWLDCTSKGPFNRLGTFTQNRNVLLVDKQNSWYVKTPELKKEDVKESRSVTVSVDSNMVAKVDFKTCLKGQSFEYLNNWSKNMRDNKLNEYISESFVPHGFELVDYKILPNHRDSDFIELNYSVKCENYFKVYGNELLVRIIPLSVPFFTEPKLRQNAVQINYPIYKTDTMIYHIPQGYVVKGVSKDIFEKTKYGEYKTTCIQQADCVKIIKTFLLNSGFYVLSQYAEFHAFSNIAYQNENNNFITLKRQ